QSLRLESLFRVISRKHLLDKGAVPLAHVNGGVAFVAYHRRPGHMGRLEPNSLARGDAPYQAQRIKRQPLFLSQADHHKALRWNRTFRWSEKDRFSKFADKFAAISQRAKQAAEMRVRVFRRALVGITGILMLEEADDLEISRLHIGPNHFDG